MKTLTINNLTFPLEMRSVYTKLDDGIQLRIPGKKVLLNSVNKLPISIVSPEYEIITNQEAYEYGIICMKTLFNICKENEIELFNIIAPEKLSFCHIDLTGKKLSHNILDEKYIPFLRITNSYNSMYKLSFKIGFCRYICKNGMIFDEESIKFSFCHVKGLKKIIDFRIKAEEFESIKSKFIMNLGILKKYNCPDQYSFPMFCKVLGLNFDLNDPNETKKAAAIIRLRDCHNQFDVTLKKYRAALGNNYYALHNTITEISTKGFTGEKLLVTRINSRQQKAGSWLKEITYKLSNDKLNYEEYLEDFMNLAKN